MTETTIGESTMHETVQMMNYLSSLGSTSPVEQILAHPELDMAGWLEQAENLVNAGLEADLVGKAITLYPELVGLDTRALTNEDLGNLNTICRAVQSLEADNSELYYKYLVKSDKDKALNLAEAGAAIWQAYQDDPELDISLLVTTVPQYFFATTDAQQQALTENISLAAYCNAEGLDTDALSARQLNALFEHMRGLDPESPDYDAAVQYLHRQIVNMPRLEKARKLGIRPANLGDGLLEFMDELPKTALSLTAGARLRALLVISGGRIETLRSAYQTIPGFLSHKFGAQMLIKGGFMSTSDLPEFKRQKSRFEKGDRVRKAQPKNYPAEQLKNVVPVGSVDTLGELMEELDFHFTSMKPEEAAIQHPELLEVSQRQFRLRIMALQSTTGNQIARVIASLRPDYIYGINVERIVQDFDLSVSEKALLRKEMNRKNSTLDAAADRARAKAEGIARYLENPAIGDPLRDVVAASGLELDADELILTNPHVLKLKPELAILRAQQLAICVGAERATAIIREFPQFLSTQRGIEAIKSRLTDEERAVLRRNIKFLNDKRSHQLTTAQ